MKLGSQLKKILKKNDLTVAKLSRSTKVSSKSIYSWLQGQSPKDLDQVVVVAKFLNVSLDYLITDTVTSEPKLNIADIKNINEELNLGNFEIILRKPK